MSRLKERRAIVLESLARRLGSAPADGAAAVNAIRNGAVPVDCINASWKFAGREDVRAWLREHATACCGG